MGIFKGHVVWQEAFQWCKHSVLRKNRIVLDPVPRKDPSYQRVIQCFFGRNAQCELCSQGQWREGIRHCHVSPSTIGRHGPLRGSDDGVPCCVLVIEKSMRRRSAIHTGMCDELSLNERMKIIYVCNGVSSTEPQKKMRFFCFPRPVNMLCFLSICIGFPLWNILTVQVCMLRHYFFGHEPSLT